MASKKVRNKKKRSPDAAVETAEREAVEVGDDAQDAAQEVHQPDPSGSEATDEQVEQLDVVTRLKREVAEWKDKFLRAKAEQKNTARRAANELEESIRYANGKLLKALLDVVDDFERTMEGASGCETVEAVIDGVKLVQEKIEKLLRDNQVEGIDAQDAPFDPARHEALMQQPSSEHEPGTVMQEVQKGYMFRERVLRPAKVIVAAAPVQEEAAAGGEAVSEGEEQQGV